MANRDCELMAVFVVCGECIESFPLGSAEDIALREEFPDHRVLPAPEGETIEILSPNHRRNRHRWHWIEDDSGYVVFVGSEADSIRYYKQHGGMRSGMHLISADAEEWRQKPAVGDYIRNSEGHRFPKPPPLRRRSRDSSQRIQRTVHEYERSERPFEPEAPRQRYAKPHHFAINQRPSESFEVTIRRERNNFYPSGFGYAAYVGRKQLQSWNYPNVIAGETPEAVRAWVVREYPRATFVDHVSNPRSSREAMRILAEQPEEYDEHAANELRLYMDNDQRFSVDAPDGPGHQGAYLRESMLRKIRRGKYDHIKAPKGWEHLVESAAKAYVKEFGSSMDWHRMFDAPTRRHVAQEIADDFRTRAAEGEFD